MERFLKSPSSEDFEVIRAALSKSVPDGTPEEIREHIVDAVSAMLPSCEIDGRMIEALLASLRADRAKLTSD